MLEILLESLFWFADLLLVGFFVGFLGWFLLIICFCFVVSLSLGFGFCCCCCFLHNFAPILVSSVLPRFESLHSTAQGDTDSLINSEACTVRYGLRSVRMLIYPFSMYASYSGFNQKIIFFCKLFPVSFYAITS